MHIDHKHNYIHELVKEKLIAIEHVGTQLADMFIKPLISNKLCTLRMFIGMFELYLGLSCADLEQGPEARKGHGNPKMHRRSALSKVMWKIAACHAGSH